MFEYIDPAIPLTKWERKALRRKVWRQWMRDWRHAILYVCTVFALIALGAFLARYVARELWQLVALAVPWTGMWVLAFWLLHRFRTARLVRQLVRTQGFDVCVRCGYWIRGDGARGDRCPECGWWDKECTSSAGS